MIGNETAIEERDKHVKNKIEQIDVILGELLVIETCPKIPKQTALVKLSSAQRSVSSIRNVATIIPLNVLETTLLVKGGKKKKGLRALRVRALSKTMFTTTWPTYQEYRDCRSKFNREH